jgi:glycosyltransferase involved in cell wall biosynthesis
VTVSVVLCTFNRAHLVAGAIDALLRQAPGTPDFEVLVVDNNSTDGTRAAVAPLLSDPRVRYLYEPEQGLSTARNRGIAEARGAIVAFTDDDVRVDPTWVGRIAALFADFPLVGFAGGRVLPVWEHAPPAWLDAAGHAPLALVDYGAQRRFIDRAHPLCLVGANLSIRRAAIAAVGMFSTHVQLLGHDAGSTEDQEIELRLLRAGFAGLYDPGLVVRTHVPPDRLRPRYHRDWHVGHGRHFARMREPSFEGTRLAPFGVPAHVYRAAVIEAVAWARDTLRLRRASAFAHELRLRFLFGFARQRIAERHHG